MSYIDLAEYEGGDILCGGPSVGIPVFANGFWISPTAIDGLTPDSRCATEEIFGPVVTLHPFFDDTEAIEIANMTDYGLAGSIWTKMSMRSRMAEQIESGMVGSTAGCMIYASHLEASSTVGSVEKVGDGVSVSSLKR